MENFTAINASKSEPIVQAAAGWLVHSESCAQKKFISTLAAETGALASDRSEVTARIGTQTTVSPASTSTGQARFQGNGMGAGSAPSRRTASITDAVNPAEATICSCRDNRRSI